MIVRNPASTTRSIPASISASASGELNVNAKAAILMDADSGTVVFEENSNDRLQIASMVKIMTLNLIFEEIEKEKK
jgi:D-alanyl-D-alanine carboxypeptidase (penicillin-binding protein 5/6)